MLFLKQITQYTHTRKHARTHTHSLSLMALGAANTSENALLHQILPYQFQFIANLNQDVSITPEFCKVFFRVMAITNLPAHYIFVKFICSCFKSVHHTSQVCEKQQLSTKVLLLCTKFCSFNFPQCIQSWAQMTTPKNYPSQPKKCVYCTGTLLTG